jgi:hypothetical protein
MRKNIISHIITAALLSLILSTAADAATENPTTTVPVRHAGPPDVAQPPAGVNIEDTTPVLATPAIPVRDESLGSVTCFACPSGEDTYHGAICMNGIACAAEGLTLEQLKIHEPAGNPAVKVALQKLEAARAELKKPGKTQSKGKALQYINTALTELKTAGLKAGCKSR